MTEEYDKRTVKLPPEVTCKKCNHTWLPRVMNIKQCPNCKSSNWNLERIYNTRSKDESKRNEK